MQAGIELSDDERDQDPYEDDLAVRGKAGRKTGGRQAGTADANATAHQLQTVCLQFQQTFGQSAVLLTVEQMQAHGALYFCLRNRSKCTR